RVRQEQQLREDRVHESREPIARLEEREVLATLQHLLEALRAVRRFGLRRADLALRDVLREAGRHGASDGEAPPLEDANARVCAATRDKEYPEQQRQPAARLLAARYETLNAQQLDQSEPRDHDPGESANGTFDAERIADPEIDGSVFVGHMSPPSQVFQKGLTPP